MKAAIYHKFQGPITVESVQDPELVKGGVIIKVEATGLCLSDWHGWMGHDPDIRLPHVPGHELAGVIVEIGNGVSEFRVGDRVTVPFVGGCGKCEQCASGNQQVCDHQFQPGFTHWGSFAEYVAIHYADENLVRIPDNMSFVTAATLGCRFITAFRAVVAQGRVEEGHFVAVHGCGGVGLSAIMIAKALGARVIAVDINDNTLSLARELGADDTVNARNFMDVIEVIRGLTKGGAHVSLDALGSRQTSFNSVSCLRKRGRHIQVGLMTGDDIHASVPYDKIVAHELEIYGSHGMQAHKYPEMLKMIAEGRLHPEKLIERTISLEEAAVLLPKMDEFRNAGVLVVEMR